MSKFAVVLASAFLWSGALHAHDTDCCYEGTAEFETCRIHGEGDGHANDGVSGGHAQPGDCCYEGTAEFETCRIHGEGDGHANDGASGGHAQPGVPHGEEVEETCYDEFNIEIDCNGHENDAVEYGEEVGYDDDDESENDAGE